MSCLYTPILKNNIEKGPALLICVVGCDTDLDMISGITELSYNTTIVSNLHNVCRKLTQGGGLG